MEGMPRSLAVIGAGVIAASMPAHLRRLGSKCTSSTAAGSAPHSSMQRSRTLADAMANGIKFRWDSRVTGCDARPQEISGLHSIQESRLDVDSVLVAAGRSSNSGTLNLQAAGITPAERGLLKVDSRFRTEYPISTRSETIGFPRWLPRVWNKPGSRWRMHSFPSRRRSFPCIPPGYLRSRK